MLQITYHGRLGNALFLCIGSSLLAKKYNLRVFDYDMPFYQTPHTNLFLINKYFELDLFQGENTFKDWVEINDKNFISALNGSPEFVNKALHINKSRDSYFQLKPFVINHKNEIKKHFKKLIYDTNVDKNDLLVHVRLGDIAHMINSWVPDLHYYDTCFKSVNFNKGYIVTDSPEHPLVLALIQKYNLQIYLGSALDTLAFAKNFNKLILSPASFSWWIGFLSTAEEIFYPIPSQGMWHGDIYFPEWKGVYF